MIRENCTTERILKDFDVRLTNIEVAIAALALRATGELSNDDLNRAMVEISATNLAVGGFVLE